MTPLSDRPSACARPYARFDVSISSMKEKSALSAGRISRRLVFRLAEFGDEGNGRSARVSFRESPEHRARPLAGAIRQVEEPVALVAGAAELWSGEGAALPTTARPSASRAQPPDQVRRRTRRHSKKLSRTWTRLQHPPRLAVEGFEAAAASRATPLHRWNPVSGGPATWQTDLRQDLNVAVFTGALNAAVSREAE